MTTEVRPALCYPDRCDIIDLSQCQDEPIDFAAVKAAGFVGVVVKVSTGESGKDPARLRMLSAARAAGLLTLVYHFHIPGENPAVAMANLMAAEGDVHPLRRALDVESFSKTLTPAQYVANVEKEIAILQKDDPRGPVIYSAPYMGVYLGAPFAASTIIGACDLWTAQYQSTTSPWLPPHGYQPKLFGPWKNWACHQYSGNGGYRVPGIPGIDVDRSLYNGDLRSFREDFLGLPSDIPPPPGVPTFSLPDLDAANDTDPDAA